MAQGQRAGINEGQLFLRSNAINGLAWGRTEFYPRSDNLSDTAAASPSTAQGSGFGMRGGRDNPANLADAYVCTHGLAYGAKYVANARKRADRAYARFRRN